MDTAVYSGAFHPTFGSSKGGQRWFTPHKVDAFVRAFIFMGRPPPEDGEDLYGYCRLTYKKKSKYKPTAAETAEANRKEDAKAAAKEAERKRKAAEAETKEAELEAEREARAAELAVKRSLGVRSVPNNAGFYSATVEVDGEMCCIGTDFMSHAAATRDAAMVVRACGGVIPDGILSDADVDMADGFVHNPIFLVKQLREKRADLLDVKVVSLKVMLDAKFIKSGKSTVFTTRFTTRYVADLCDDGTITYAGETYAGPRNWVDFIVNGSVSQPLLIKGRQAWNYVRYGKEDGPTQSAAPGTR